MLKIFGPFVNVFRPFHKGTFLKNFSFQNSVVKFKAKYKKYMFRHTLQNDFNNYKHLCGNFLPKGWCQFASKDCNNSFNFTKLAARLEIRGE